MSRGWSRLSRVRKVKGCVGLVMAVALLGCAWPATAQMRPGVSDAPPAAPRTPAAGRAPSADLVVYGDALAGDWDPNWSWDTTFDTASAAQAHGGSKSIALTFNAAWAGFSIRTSSPENTSGYSGVRFWAYGGAGGTQIQAGAQITDGSAISGQVALSVPAGTWTQFNVTMAQLGNPGQIARIDIQDGSGGAQAVFYVDDIALVGTTSTGGLPDPTADRVLGQGAFNTNGSGTTATTMDGPAGIAVAPAGAPDAGRLFVVEYNNNRVLSWPDAASFTSGQAADVVFGQANFTSGGGALEQNRLFHPEAATVDAQGRLFVADTENARVLLFAPPFSNGMNASVVFGQPDFVSPHNQNNQGGATAANTLCYPRGLATDSSGNLYVADDCNNRVVRYSPPFASNMNATLVLGQSSFTANGAATTQVGLRSPKAVAVDGAGNVYVAEYNNNRVTRFAPPLSSGMDASGVFGQPDYDSATPNNGGIGAGTLNSPVDLAVSAAGNALFVTDQQNVRVLGYSNPLTDTQADAVYGQPDYTSVTPNNGGVSATSLNSEPLGVAVDAGGDLFAVDYQNNRVLAYDMPAAPPPPPPPAEGTATVRIRSTAAGTPIDARLFGTNLATWNGDKLAEATFRARTAASGVSVIRMPGGSYSNWYGWLTCEMGSNQPGALPCGDNNQHWETWAARPTDFINFVKAVNKPGMWTVSINGTSKEAAAAVAFFNARASDNTLIGVDIRGTNWYTAGHWAQLRSAHGNPEPLGIKLWNVSNEVYGGKPGFGTNCDTPWGWENVWTCDGTEYVNGIGSGASRHEGFIEFRNAMRVVDPTIAVGAVGVTDQSSWHNWGNKVIAAAKNDMDFYEVHAYAYDTPPAYATALAHPQSEFTNLKANINAAYTANGAGEIPIGVTEHNLFATGCEDTGQMMTRAVNGLSIADSLGQMALNGFAMGNQWILGGNDFVGLCGAGADTNTDYGLIRLDHNYMRSPQYFSYVLWSRFGSVMVPVTSTAVATATLSVYAGRVGTDTVVLLAINKTGQPITTTVQVDAGAPLTGGLTDVARAGALTDQAVSFNGIAENNLSDDLSNAPAQVVSASGSEVTYSFAPYSVTLLRLGMQIAAPPDVQPWAYIPLAMR
jgi:hypothetical protein